MAVDVVFGYPELEWLKDDEVFVEQVHIVKGMNRHKILIKRIVKRVDTDAIRATFIKDYDADDIYLTTIEK